MAERGAESKRDRGSFFFGSWYELSEFAYLTLKITPFHGRLRRGGRTSRVMRKVWMAFVTGFSGRRASLHANLEIFRPRARQSLGTCEALRIGFTNPWDFTSGNKIQCKDRCNPYYPHRSILIATSSGICYLLIKWYERISTYIWSRWPIRNAIRVRIINDSSCLVHVQLEFNIHDTNDVVRYIDYVIPP